MPDQIGSTLGNGSRTPAENRQRTDELLTKIEDGELIPEWCWTRMLATVEQLSALGDDLSWTVPAYLATVVVRGHKMFPESARFQPAMFDEERAVTLPCPCGHDTPAAKPLRRDGRLVQLASCEQCLRPVAMFDEQPYTLPTLLTKGVV